MITIDRQRTPADLVRSIDRLFELSGGKIRALDRRWGESSGAPVFTVGGSIRRAGGPTGRRDFSSDRRCCSSTRPASRVPGDRARAHARPHDPAPHPHRRARPWLQHREHLRGAVAARREGRIDASEWEVRLYELALKVSGAVQAPRWTPLPGGGFIHSFNGAHSLFVDTIRSLRVLALAHALGHVLMDEQDARVSLLERLVQHAHATARFQRLLRPRARRLRRPRPRRARGDLQRRQRLVPQPQHAAGLLAVHDVDPRTRMGDLGFAEQLEFLETVDDDALDEWGGRAAIDAWMLDAGACHRRLLHHPRCRGRRRAVLGHRCAGTAALGEWGGRPADPFNDHEPVDSSAAAIAAQGLLRLGRVLARGRGRGAYEQAGLRTLDALFNPARRVPGHRSGARRPVAALRLSLAEPLGPRARGRAYAARRVESVGRLPRARGGAVRAPARAGRAVLDVLRPGSPRAWPGLH